MLKPNNFTKGENDSQFYYFFKNEVIGDSVDIIKNKRETHWFGHYRHNDTSFTIPVYMKIDIEEMLESICYWYNNGKNKVHYEEPPEITAKNVSKTLSQITNAFGDFPEHYALKIQSYINNPTFDRWDDISGIIINGKNTLWQLILEIDSNFPRSGRRTDITGQIVKEWEKIPNELTVLRAIKFGLANK